MKYIKNLIKNCKIAINAKPDRVFILKDIADLKDINKAIYIIRQKNGNPVDTFNKLSEYKKKKQRACPRLNSPCEIMYVGSSCTGLKSRILQHKGNGPTMTYSLNLCHWFTGDYEIEIRTYDVSDEILQIIEDALSYEMSPAFGKRGPSVSR